MLALLLRIGVGRGYVASLFRSFSISSGLVQLHDWAHWVSTLVGRRWFVLGSLLREIEEILSNNHANVSYICPPTNFLTLNEMGF